MRQSQTRLYHSVLDKKKYAFVAQRDKEPTTSWRWEFDTYDFWGIEKIPDSVESHLGSFYPSWGVDMFGLYDQRSHKEAIVLNHSIYRIRL